jgi:hypothetical protein
LIEDETDNLPQERTGCRAKRHSDARERWNRMILNSAGGFELPRSKETKGKRLGHGRLSANFIRQLNQSEGITIYALFCDLKNETVASAQSLAMAEERASDSVRSFI